MKLKQIFSRDMIILVLGQVISLFGNAIVRFALPLYLLRETNSPSLFGVVTACSFLPMVVFSFLGGGIADRVNKRNIMVALDFATSLLMVGLALALEVLPLVPLLIGVLMLLYGISGAYQPSVQASLPLLVPEEGLVQANALVNMVSTLAGLLGPVVGGVLFGAFGVYPIVLVSALCFFASAVMECFLRIPHNGRPRTDSLLRTVKGDLAESWRFMGREKPNFLRVTLLLALFNLVLSAAIIVGIPIMVVQLLHGSDTQLGLTQGALGLGGLMGVRSSMGPAPGGLGARRPAGALTGQRAGGKTSASPQPAAVAVGLRRGGPHGSCPSAPGFSYRGIWVDHCAEFSGDGGLHPVYRDDFSRHAGADPSGSVGKGDGHGAGYGQLRPTLGTGGLWSAV